MHFLAISNLHYHSLLQILTPLFHPVHHLKLPGHYRSHQHTGHPVGSPTDPALQVQYLQLHLNYGEYYGS